MLDLITFGSKMDCHSLITLLNQLLDQPVFMEQCCEQEEYMSALETAQKLKSLNIQYFFKYVVYTQFVR